MYSESVTLDGFGEEGSALESTLDIDDVEEVELVELGKKYDWFSVAQSRNQKPQRYHPLEPEDAPYFASYSHASSNWFVTPRIACFKDDR